VEYLFGRLEGGLKTLNKKYGEIYFSNFFLAPMFYVGSYAAASDALKDDGLFLAHNTLPGLQDLFGDDVLLVVDGKDHEVARKLLGPAFFVNTVPVLLENNYETNESNLERNHRCREKRWADSTRTSLPEALSRYHY